MSHHVWDLQAVSENAGIQTLHWDKNTFADSEKKLLLFDTELQIKTDMGIRETYAFESSGKRTFKIYYGTPDFIDGELMPENLTLGAAYPNPFSEVATIPVRLPPAERPYQVSLCIYNSTGQKVHTLAQGIYRAGFHEFLWDARSGEGGKLPRGLYTVLLTVSTEGKVQEMNSKLMLK
jgi:hypothetical protein